MEKLQLLAPAKVNYRLDVLGKRPDGYHELRMVMQRVALCDDISIALSATPGIRVTCGKKGVPDGPGNIAWRAADALLKLSGKEVGIDIAIDKRIPVAAGLGGGSSDAATVLMGVNQLLGLGLSDEQLMDIGVKLGADVPFFIFKKTALAEGIGDKLTAMESMPSLWVVLVNPGIHVPTAWVYQNLVLTEKGPATIISGSYSSAAEVAGLLSNDLEPVTCGKHPVLNEVKDMLLVAGASGSLMSGSGATVFGIFEDEEVAKKAAADIAAARGWFAEAVQTL
ncbi:4-(cytidine 5'-diphospho)-2-C-methyl-D-erythritol kinase [Geomonas oryzisoli]|uniref:4-diphosphocytidyl-2-C-methyl-D-erythritol kinase n=1 Tax=Geomonas oryzisoli TaxID=2847992 RepID=A0ABX8JAQ3_9BACT|nr:4-(cytidine 5'-diphospho)-2-C-methyl-D-erythritol kinase [Geomonas oryzisoli]QWV94873.1 4-(cytidine 5'-diphospho)-2-C-methyl-D-erythritol kinase [Geomonas oryzisoli]